jgi:hypothetical protein
MPQVTFQLLPVLQGGEGLEVDTEMNEGITVNYVDADNSWTLVQKRKKRKVKKDSQEEKWNAQQRENFLRFGDIYKGEPYINYRNVDVGPPVANIPLQQSVAQPPVVQVIPPPPAIPAPVQHPPIIAAAPPPPIIIVTPPPERAAPVGQKRPGLEAIPEEDEEEEEQPELQGAGYRSPASSSSASSPNASFNNEDYRTPLDTPACPARKSGSPFGARGEAFLAELERLALASATDFPGRKLEVHTNEGGEGAAKVLGAAKPFPRQLAEAGPPSQRTRQMQKDLEQTLLKRYEESKALEKKKKKEIKKEQP